MGNVLCPIHGFSGRQGEKALKTIVSTMYKKITVIVILLLLLLNIFPFSVAANTNYNVNTINGLGAVYNEDCIILRWHAKVVDNSDGIKNLPGSPEVTIKRSMASDSVDGEEYVYTEEVGTVFPAEAGESVLMEWKDENISADRTYKYIVSVDGKTLQTTIKASKEPTPPAPDPNNPANQDVDQGGPLERILAGLVEAPITVIKWLTDKAGMQPIDRLVFLNGMSEDEKNIAPWTIGELNFIRLWYLALGGLSIPLFLIVITISAYKLMVAGVGNPGLRTEAIDSIWRWFGALAIVIVAPLLIQALMSLVGIILDGIQVGYVAVSNAAGNPRPIGDLGQINFDNVVTGSVLGTAIVKCMLMFIYLWLNTIYLVRKLALSVMFCFTPFMAIMWAMNKNVNAAAIWAGELASNAFMPVAHALVLCLVLGLCDVKNIGNGSWFTILVFMYTVMPLAEVIRNSMQNLFTRASGLNEAGAATGALAAVFGLGGVASLARVGKSTFGGTKLGNIDVPGGGPTSPGAVSGGGATAAFAGVPVSTSGGSVGMSSSSMGAANIPGSPGGSSGIPSVSVPGGGSPMLPSVGSPVGMPGGANMSTGITGVDTANISGSSSDTMPLAGPTGANMSGNIPVAGGRPGANISPGIPVGVPGSVGSMGSFGTNATGTGNVGTTQQASNIPPSSKWPSYAIKGAGVAGTAVGALFGMAAGAVPGGREAARLIKGVSVGGMRGTAAAGAVLGKAMQKYAQNSSNQPMSLSNTQKPSFSQSLRDATGVKSDGLKGTATALLRVGQVGVTAAGDEKKGIEAINALQQSNSLEPSKVTYRPPVRGLK